MPTTASEQFTGQSLFPLLRPEQVHALSEVAEKLSLEAGDIVYSRGDVSEHLYVVLEGQISLRVSQSSFLCRVGKHRGLSVDFELPVAMAPRYPRRFQSPSTTSARRA